MLLAGVGHQDPFVPINWMSAPVAVLSCGPCPCSRLYMGVLGANHGGQTCVAASRSIMISTLRSSCWTDCSVDAIGVDDIVLSSAATRCISGVCCSCAVVGCGAVSASCDVYWAAGIVAHCPGNSLFGHCCTSWQHSPCLGNNIVPCCRVVAHMLYPKSCRLLFYSLWPSGLVGHICSCPCCWLLCSFLVLYLFLSLVATLVFLLSFLLLCRSHFL